MNDRQRKIAAERVSRARNAGTDGVYGCTIYNHDTCMYGAILFHLLGPARRLRLAQVCLC